MYVDPPLSLSRPLKIKNTPLCRTQTPTHKTKIKNSKVENFCLGVEIQKLEFRYIPDTHTHTHIQRTRERQKEREMSQGGMCKRVKSEESKLFGGRTRSVPITSTDNKWKTAEKCCWEYNSWEGGGGARRCGNIIYFDPCWTLLLCISSSSHYSPGHHRAGGPTLYETKKRVLRRSECVQVFVQKNWKNLEKKRSRWKSTDNNRK